MVVAFGDGSGLAPPLDEPPSMKPAEKEDNMENKDQPKPGQSGHEPDQKREHGQGQQKQKHNPGKTPDKGAQR